MGDPQPDKNGCKIVSLDNWGAGTYAVLLAETYKCVRVKDGHSTHKIPDSVGPQDTERLKQTLQELGLPFENVGWHMAVEPW